MMTNRFEKTITSFIILMGVLLPVVQFLFNRSLCGDEVWLSLNILDRNYSGLFQPLDHVQSAPILFLLIEKTFFLITPHSEFGLKTFPLICYFLSLIFFYKILRVISKDHYTLVFALALFVFNVFIIRYSNEVKQYMCDVLVLTGLYYLLLRTYKKPSHKYFYLGLMGAISIFLSNASITILFTLGLYLIYNIYLNDKKHFRFCLYVFPVWLLSFFLYYYLFIINNPVKDAMVEVWIGYFMPLNPFTFHLYEFIIQKSSWIFLTFFQYGNLGEGLIILFILGIINMIKNKQGSLYILMVVPILVQFLLSGLKLYPVSPRTFLFLCPLVIIICSFGFQLIVTLVFRIFKIKESKLIAFCIPLTMVAYFTFLIYVNGYPIRRSEIRGSIKFIENNIELQDNLYIGHYGIWAYRFYNKVSYMKINTVPIDGTVRYKQDSENYYQELDSLHGRTWLLFVDFGDDNHENRKMVTGYLDTKKQKVINQFHTFGSDVYLYDLD